MDNKEAFGLANYTGLFEKAHDLFNKTPKEIIDSYPDKDKNLSKWKKNNTTEVILEIRFNEVMATFNCEFDKKKNLHDYKCIYRCKPNSRRIYPSV